MLHLGILRHLYPGKGKSGQMTQSWCIIHVFRGFLISLYLYVFVDEGLTPSL